MLQVRVTAPNRAFNGSVGGVSFNGGTATLDAEEHISAMAYFRRHDYQIEYLESDEEAPKPRRKRKS